MSAVAGAILNTVTFDDESTLVMDYACGAGMASYVHLHSFFLATMSLKIHGISFHMAFARTLLTLALLKALYHKSLHRFPNAS